MFVKFPFGTEIRMSQQNHERVWSGFGMITVGIHPNNFDINPIKIPPGGIVQKRAIFDILELAAFRKYSICWVFYDALCLCR